MRSYGSQIGKKFCVDGSAALYPGNTVLSDVHPGNPAYETMRGLRQMALDAGMGELLILLPEDSYHMTVIRGLNDSVRTDAFWPSALSKQATIREMDEYVSRAVASAKSPQGFTMRFLGVNVTQEDFRVLVEPADQAQEQSLRRYRDQVADALGLRLAGHETYRFHITLAYMHYLPDASERPRMEALLAQMNQRLSEAPSFHVDAPHIAFYQDMLVFSPERKPMEPRPM